MKKLIISVLVLTLNIGCGVAEGLGRECGGTFEQGCHTIFGGNRANDQDYTNNLKNQEQDQRLKNLELRLDNLELLNIQIKITTESLAPSVYDLQSQIETLNLKQTQFETAVQADEQSDNLAQVNLQNQITITNQTLNSLNQSIIALQTTTTDQTTLITQLQNSVTQLQQTSNSQQVTTQNLGNSVTVLQNALLALQNQSNANTVQLATLQGYTNIVSIKDPCGKQVAADEVLLKLSDGRYLVSFSDNAAGLNTRFSVLGNGTYVTSDGTHCYFQISNNGLTISNEHN
jgi:hypothetical protein